VRALIESQLASRIDATLVCELLDAHAEAKRNFYLGGLRLSAVEGGRFCEAAFRILEHETKNRKFTPLGKTLASTDKLMTELANLDSSKFSDAIRLHIPRSLRVVYDIRNKRDTAHLADGIDPNLQDATLVIAVIDWILAEFIRIYHNVTANDASAIVKGIVTRVAPVVQDFNGFLKILNPTLGPSDHCLVLLYQRGEKGATFDELSSWARPAMRANLRRTLRVLENEKDLIHSDGASYLITRLGERHVENKNLITPQQLA
jgi:hypothetical protein